MQLPGGSQFVLHKCCKDFLEDSIFLVMKLVSFISLGLFFQFFFILLMFVSIKAIDF